jgi:hypothetical protein
VPARYIPHDIHDAQGLIAIVKSPAKVVHCTRCLYNPEVRHRLRLGRRRRSTAPHERIHDNGDGVQSTRIRRKGLKEGDGWRKKSPGSARLSISKSAGFHAWPWSYDTSPRYLRPREPAPRIACPLVTLVPPTCSAQTSRHSPRPPIRPARNIASNIRRLQRT